MAMSTINIKPNNNNNNNYINININISKLPHPLFKLHKSIVVRGPSSAPAAPAPAPAPATTPAATCATTQSTTMPSTETSLLPQQLSLLNAKKKKKTDVNTERMSAYKKRKWR